MMLVGTLLCISSWGFNKQSSSYTVRIFQDRHTVGYQEPLVDLQQDYNMTYSEEVNGTTTVEFHRKRLTNDSKDIDIKVRKEK